MLSKKIASLLLEIEAISLQPQKPFTWTSGILSPIYCDNRLTMSYPEVREQITDGFVGLIQEQFKEVDVIAGTATAGIPHAAWVAAKLNLPMIYVRDKAKSHGKKNQIEGKLDEGDRVLVIEDTISTGGSALKAADAVVEAGGQVVGVAAIFSYQFDRALDAFASKNVKLSTLSDYPALIEVALEKGVIQQSDVNLLQSWRANPEGFGK
jgi:orotate phosphoribosyltransferase